MFGNASFLGIVHGTSHYIPRPIRVSYFITVKNSKKVRRKYDTIFFGNFGLQRSFLARIAFARTVIFRIADSKILGHRLI